MLSDVIKQQIRDILQRIKVALPHYQPRAGQNKLIAEIANTLAGAYHNHDRVALVEAGTGTGKSLAYMLAAIPYALSRNKKVVIATATVALQEQLADKDLPFFQQHSQLPFEFCLVKGRQRYACIERIKQQLTHPELFPSAGNASQPEVLDKLLTLWQERRWLGDRDTLPDAVPDDLWFKISADPFHCSKSDRKHHHCPFHLARAEITGSDVMIVNHALLLADLAAGSSTLPAPEDTIYIIDEAHHLPDCGREYFSAQAQLTHNKNWLDKISSTVQKLTTLLPESAIKDLYKFADACNELSSLLMPIERFSSELSAKWFAHTTEYRFTDAQLPSLWQQQAEYLAQASQKALSLTEKIYQLLQDSITEQKLPAKTTVSLLQDLALYAQKLEQQQGLWQLHSIAQTLPAQQARWVSIDKHSAIVSACASPLNIGSKLDNLLFSQAFGCIMCSATLTALNSFQYIKYEAGLTQHEGLRTLQVPSPFAYDVNGSILIPSMQYEPTQTQYTQELIEILPNHLPEKQGSLVLFTSYKQMQEVASALRESGFSLLVQGEASRQALLTLHRQRCEHGETSILFGTQSFSEGLDLPGKLLTNLVITKLPFAVPTSPLEEAMAEAITRKGGNAFLQLTIPATSKKLVQACGRLLRQEQDHGQIVILDRRLVTKSYGTAMLNALPPFKRYIG